MPMFIITGSRIRQAISSPRSASSCSKASASLNGTTSVYLAVSAGMPADIGVVELMSRLPTASALGSTENITASWCPWYEPSILTMTSRPVAARATRMASIVASVPELANRTLSSSKRRQISSASSTVVGVGAAKCVPWVTAWVTASTISGWAWPAMPTPNPPWKSRYSLPSTSQTWLPSPRST